MFPVKNTSVTNLRNICRPEGISELSSCFPNVTQKCDNQQSILSWGNLGFMIRNYQSFAICGGPGAGQSHWQQRLTRAVVNYWHTGVCRLIKTTFCGDLWHSKGSAPNQGALGASNTGRSYQRASSVATISCLKPCVPLLAPALIRENGIPCNPNSCGTDNGITQLLERSFLALPQTTKEPRG